MPFVLNFFQFFSLSIGMASLVVGLVVYYYYQYKTIKYYIFFLIIVTVRVFLNSILFSMRFDNLVIDSAYYQIMLLCYQIFSDCSVIMLFIVPYLFHHILDNRLRGFKNKFLFGGFILTLLILSYPYFFPRGWFQSMDILEVVNQIPKIILFAIAFYLPLEIFFNRKKLKDNYYALALTATSLIYFYSTIIFDQLVSRRTFIYNNLGDQKLMWMHLVFYFCWNGFFLIFIIITLSGLTRQNRSIQPNEAFFSKYGISDREKDVIQMVLQGMTTKEMGEKLFISPKTVKNHIGKIYQKTGVENRIELSILIQNCPDFEK